MRRTTPPMERLMKRVGPIESADACWTVTSGLTAAGYARVSVYGSETYAHRYAYETFVQPIADGLVIDHLCRNRACINPNHLEAVTQRTNVLRGDRAGKRAPGTHCKKGHEFTEANTYTSPDGRRTCRECRRFRLASKRSAA